MVKKIIAVSLEFIKKKINSSIRFINYIKITGLLFILGFIPTVILVDYMHIKVLYVLPPIVVINWLLRYKLMYWKQ